MFRLPRRIWPSTIAGRILGFNGLVIVIAFSMGAITWVALLAVSGHLETTVTERVPAVVALEKYDKALAKGAMALRGLMIPGLPDPERAIAYADFEEAMRDIAQARQEYEQLPESPDSVRTRALWAEMQPAWVEWKRHAMAVLADQLERDGLVREGLAAHPRVKEIDRGVVERMTRARPLRASLSSKLETLSRIERERMSTSAKMALSWARSVNRGLPATVALVSVFLMAVALILRRSIGKQVSALIGEATRLRQAVADGFLGTRCNPRTVGREFRAVVDGLNTTMDAFVKPIQLTARYVERIAAGDVPPKIVSEYRGDFNALKDSLNACIDAVHARTEAQRLQAELSEAQKLEAVGRLAAGIAHEINTPIQYIGDNTRFLEEAFLAFVRLLERYREEIRPEAKAELRSLEDELDIDYVMEQAPKTFSRTLGGVDRVATIVRAMKEFAHPDQAEMVASDLNRAIQATLEVARNEYKYVADVELDLKELPLVTCHVGDINQVVLNIVVNAAHAISDAVKGTSKRGTIRVSSRCEVEEVVVAIADTGTGIPDGVRNKVFEPFFTTKEVGRGTGQGLAIARSIMTKHRGTISFESTPGTGTTFFLRLPISQAGAQAQVSEQATA